MNQAPAQIVLFGPQGSGKGTQAERLAEHYGAKLIGAGDLLREIAQGEGPQAAEVAKTIEAGQLVPDDLISEIVLEQLEGMPAEQGFVLEGYPRTANQAVQLKGLLEKFGRNAEATVFINLDVPREVQLQRLLERKRHDDTEEVIQQRLRLYEERTAPILGAVTDWARVINVNGNQPMDAVTESVIKEFEDAKAKA